MGGRGFSFKQFHICQEKCAMKVGTDGVLLGAWAEVNEAREILDIGTGTGLVALMLAQRSEARITALEIDADAAAQAAENVAQSPWEERVEVLCCDFKAYRPTGLFDVIVSNPPYFLDSLIAPEEARTMARHNITLTYDDLLAGAAALLASSGKFTVIIPFDVVEKMVRIAASNGLYPCRQLNVITAPGKAPKRALLAFSFRKDVCVAEELLLEKERHVYSDEYVALTRDFYLKM